MGGRKDGLSGDPRRGGNTSERSLGESFVGGVFLEDTENKDK